MIANRVHTAVPAHRADLRGEMDELLGRRPGAQGARATWRSTRVLAERDRAASGACGSGSAGAPMIEVPRLDDDVHDLDGLALHGRAPVPGVARTPAAA